MERLVLHRPERAKLTLRLDDLFDARGSEAADHLVLEVGDAHMEAERLRLRSIQSASDAGLLEAAGSRRIPSRSSSESMVMTFNNSPVPCVR